MALPDQPEQGIFFDASSADRYHVSPLDVERANINIFLREAKKYLDPKDVECLSGQLYTQSLHFHPVSSWERRLLRLSKKHEAKQEPKASEFNDAPHPAQQNYNVYDVIVYLSNKLKRLTAAPDLSKKDYLHYLESDFRNETYVYALIAIHEWMMHFRDPKDGYFEMEVFSMADAKKIYAYFEAKELIRLIDKKHRTAKENVFENENTFIVSFVAKDPKTASEIIRLPGSPDFFPTIQDEIASDMSELFYLKKKS
jgi:hypothetical protein